MESETISLDKLLLDEDTNDQFIRGLMGSVVLATQTSNQFTSSKSHYYEYSNEIKNCKDKLYTILNDISKFIDDKNHIDLSDDMNDSSVYDHIIDLVDKLLDDADIRINELSPHPSSNHSSHSNISKVANSISMSMALDKERILQQQLQNIDKPQLQFLSDIDNSRERPFKPRLTTSKPNAQVSLDLSERPVIFNSNKDSVIPNEYVAPNYYYSHPYEYELKKLQYLDSQLEEPLTPRNRTWLPLDGNITVIETVEALNIVIDELNLCTEIAIDLEHHSLRSFQGFTCLMQISSRDKDYIIDTIKLRKDLSLLNQITTNPTIVKVFHGCESDIAWLQKDFGIYVVNCFDTYQAAKLLRYPALSLAHLLKVCCNITINKRHQLSDWRQRPLPIDMLIYARGDTHYLLYIYDRLRREVWVSRQREGLLFVLDATKKICMQRYEKEFFWPLGYRKLLDNPRGIGLRSDALTAVQEAVLAKLWDWRDLKARNLDESTHYVMSNAELLRIGTATPRTMSQLEKCAPLSLCVQSYRDEIIQLITEQFELTPASYTSDNMNTFNTNMNTSSITSSSANTGHMDSMNNNTSGSSNNNNSNNNSNSNKLSSDERLYGRALKTPSKDLAMLELIGSDGQFIGQSPSPMAMTSGVTSGLRTTGTGDVNLPFQPYNQSTVLSISPMSVSPQPVRQTMTSPVLFVDDVFQYAKWNSGMNMRAATENDHESDEKTKLAQVRKALERESNNLLAANASASTISIENKKSIPISINPEDRNSIPDSAPIISQPPMTEREVLVNMLLSSNNTNNNNINSQDIDNLILSQLPGSFTEIYNISNDLRKKKVDKKRIRESSDDLILNPAAVSINTNSNPTLGPKSIILDGSNRNLNAILSDTKIMGSRMFDENIYLKISNDQSSQPTINPDKEIENSLDIAESLGWVKSSEQRESIKQQHILEMMAQQPDSSDNNPDGTNNGSHHSAHSSGSSGYGNSSASNHSYRQSGENKESTTRSRTSPGGSPGKPTSHKAYDYSKHSAIGALPNQNSTNSSSRESNHNSSGSSGNSGHSNLSNRSGNSGHNNNVTTNNNPIQQHQQHQQQSQSHRRSNSGSGNSISGSSSNNNNNNSSSGNRSYSGGTSPGSHGTHSNTHSNSSNNTNNTVTSGANNNNSGNNSASGGYNPYFQNTQGRKK